MTALPPPNTSLRLELMLLRRFIGCISRIAVGGDHMWLTVDGGRICASCHRRQIIGTGRTVG